MRSAEEAAAYARQRAASGEVMAASGYCLQFTRENYPIDPYYYSAVDAAQGAEYPHPAGTPDGDNPPLGVPVYFLSSNPYRHVGLYVGQGEVATVWNEEIRVVPWSEMTRTFGPYKGWAEDLNEVRVYSSTTPPAAEQEDDMRLIRAGSSGQITLIGDGWYLHLGDSSVEAFTHLGLPTVKLATADYNTVVACLKQADSGSVLGQLLRGGS